MNSIQVSNPDEWWLEIKTAVPECIYCFGPFFSKKEAKILQYGHIEDLRKQKAHGIVAKVKRISPKKLTIKNKNE